MSDDWRVAATAALKLLTEESGVDETINILRDICRHHLISFKDGDDVHALVCLVALSSSARGSLHTFVHESLRIRMSVCLQQFRK